MRFLQLVFFSSQVSQSNNKYRNERSSKCQVKGTKEHEVVLWSALRSREQIIHHFPSLLPWWGYSKSFFFLHKESFNSCCILPYWRFCVCLLLQLLFVCFCSQVFYQPLQLKAVCQVSSNYVMVNNDFHRRPPIDSPRSVQITDATHSLLRKSFCNKSWITTFSMVSFWLTHN